METEPLPPLEHLPPRFDDNSENVQGMCIHHTICTTSTFIESNLQCYL